MPESSEESARPLIVASFEEYAERRIRYYASAASLLRKLLAKDVLLFALRGVRTADEFIEEALAAHESSSEETMMGNAWQAAIAEISPHAVGGGDVRVERDGTLWIVQLKTGTEQNSSAEAQDLRILRTKVLSERDHQPRRKNVMPMLAIIRGPTRNEGRWYRAGSPANRDIDGFHYQYMVGRAFREWISADFDPGQLLKYLEEPAARVREARQACIIELKTLLRARLSEQAGEADIASILALSLH